MADIEAGFIFTPLCSSFLSFPLLLDFRLFRLSQLSSQGKQTSWRRLRSLERPCAAYRINLRFRELSRGSVEFSGNFPPSCKISTLDFLASGVERERERERSWMQSWLRAFQNVMGLHLCGGEFRMENCNFRASRVCKMKQFE